MRPSGPHSLRPVLPIGAPGVAGADGAAAAPADGVTVGASAVAAAGAPIDAAEPGAGPAPDPGGGLMQPPSARNPTESVPNRSLFSIFIVVLVFRTR